MNVLRNLVAWIAFIFSCLGPAYSVAQTSPVNSEARTGTYAQMLQRGQIRIAVPYDRSIYVNDKGVSKGLAVEMAKGIQTWINRHYANELEGKTVSVKLIPTNSPDLFASLDSGDADMVIGDLGLNEPPLIGRKYILNHVAKLQRELLVAGPSSIAISKPEDLSGQIVYGGPNTNFHTTLQALNKNLRHEGKNPVEIISPVGKLDPEDLLQMVDSGLIPFVIISDWRVLLWKPIYKNLVIYEDIFSKDSGWIGRGVHSSNQDLNDVITNFVESSEFDEALKSYREEEYKAHIQGLKDPIERSAWTRFESMLPLFNKFGAQYNLDPLFIAALGFQETLLNQNAVSKGWRYWRDAVDAGNGLFFGCWGYPFIGT
ncbi:transglycosylase SLT domain-containing protein [Polynucleobacter necessarius]|uniref:hypothetical protein n=1 Tax=Polynucleobacter necessarius TaxID=576610 RepID=UPI000E09414C|nr:hypothetical protein [Polynucleobacter necessarius]